MTFEEKTDALAKMNPNALLPDGCDGGLVGYVTAGDGFTVAVYSAQDTIHSLSETFEEDEEGHAFESALEWFEYNTLGSIVPNGPVYVEDLGDDDDEDAFTWQLMTLPYDGESFRPFEDLTFNFFNEQDRTKVALAD